MNRKEKEKIEKLKRIKEERHKRKKDRNKKQIRKKEVKQKKKVKRVVRELKRNIYKKEKKNVRIDDIIGQGIRQIKVNDINKEGENTINSNYEKLFEYTVKDKEIRKILSREENIQKIKWRFETKLKLYDMNNKLLGEAVKGSGGDLQEAKSITKNHLRKGRKIEKDYSNDLRIELEKKGWKFNYIESGNIERVEAQLIFRKGLK